jgi:putative oxidoreductase
MGASPVNQQALAEDIGRLVVRITVAGLILFHGMDKLFHGIEWMRGPLQSLHLPFIFAYGVFVGEVLAPLFVLAGVLTRIGALFIAFSMIMALVLDAGRLILTINPGGGWGIELEAFYLLGALAIALLGPGRFRLRSGKGFWA